MEDTKYTDQLKVLHCVKQQIPTSEQHSRCPWTRHSDVDE